MKLVEINWKPSDRQLRQFGFVCLIVLPLVAWFWNASAIVIAVLAAVGLVVALLALVTPQAVRPLFLGLSLVAAPIGLVVGELALLSIYFVIFLPIGLFFRWVRKDALKIKMDRQAESYWQSRSENADVSQYYRRY